jgi:Tfp pilus assembly protein PilF
LATLALISGDAEKATHLLEQAVADAPGLSEGYSRLAAVWLERGETQQARQILDRARDLGIELGEAGAALRNAVGP